MGRPILLFVEDDTEVLEDTAYLLRDYFEKIYTAVDGEDALNSYSENNPDIVLLDINIPKINGLDVASKIREKNKTIPIIFLTAHSEKDKLLRAIDLHAESYLIKPYMVDRLKEKISEAIEKIKKDTNKIYLNSDFIWDKDSYELFYNKEQILLTKNETLLIETLIANRLKFLTVQELYLDIFSNDDIKENSVVQLISRFKSKIKKATMSDAFFIENIYGSGYRIKSTK
ncbi:MAG: response regulator transcription factor [Campylobacterales bacterium]|nr:response regulator transcription factor [Campylobacterales bacterium]